MFHLGGGVGENAVAAVVNPAARNGHMATAPQKDPRGIGLVRLSNAVHLVGFRVVGIPQNQIFDDNIIAPLFVPYGYQASAEMHGELFLGLDGIHTIDNGKLAPFFHPGNDDGQLLGAGPFDDKRFAIGDFPKVDFHPVSRIQRFQGNIG